MRSSGRVRRMTCAGPHAPCKIGHRSLDRESAGEGDRRGGLLEQVICGPFRTVHVRITQPRTIAQRTLMRTGPENYAFRNRQTYDAHIKTQLDAASINIVRAKP